MSEFAKGKLEYSGNGEVVGLQTRETGERIAFIKPANYDNAAELVRRWNSHNTLLEACEKIKGLIGNIDHSKGHGVNSAKLRGDLLNDIRNLAKAAIAQAKE